MPYLLHLDDRIVLRATGADVRDFLQGLVSNDMRRLSPPSPIYAALLSAQGKYLFDFLLVEETGGAILIDADAEQAPALTARLNMYKLRREVRIASTELRVWAIWGEEAPAPAPGRVLADPRAKALGMRAWLPHGEAPKGVDANVGDYEALRLSVGAPRAGVDLISDDSYILEAGFERLHGVDFRKGCYVGQEVTARMKHKTELRKGLRRVAIEGAAPPPGAPVTVGGKPAGTMRSSGGGVGIAHLRFDRIEGGEIIAGDARLRLLD